MQNIAITSFMNLLIENIKKFIVITFFSDIFFVVALKLRQDFCFKLMMIQNFRSKVMLILTIHSLQLLQLISLYKLMNPLLKNLVRNNRVLFILVMNIVMFSFEYYRLVILDIIYTKEMLILAASNSNKPYKKSSTLTRSLIIYVITLIYLSTYAKGEATSITDSTCVFKNQGNLFTLTALNKIADGKFYTIPIDVNTSVIFNFCDPFTPIECSGDAHIHQKAYSFIINKTQSGNYQCFPFSSDSKTHYFMPQYQNIKGEIKVNLSMSTRPIGNTSSRMTDFILDCQESDDGSLKSITLGQITPQKLIIFGSTPHACPVFQISSIWKAIADNLLIFGTILFIVGFVMLFFGVLMTHLMIFIAAYFLSFAVLTMIATAFLRPDSSTVTIYFALLGILFLSTLIAYALTRLVRVSIFCIGAFFGFIVAAIVNSIFCKIFNIYSIWSLVVFEVIFTIPFGLLTFKFSQEVIVLSTSLAGAYMMVRPFSWIIGGFPNQFTLYMMIQNGQIKTLPWSFFIYILVIILIAIMGALYQLLKIKRRDPKAQVQTNFITSKVEVHIDKIKQAVENMITLYSPQPNQQDYKHLHEMEQIRKSGIKIQDSNAKKERKSRQQNF